MSLDTRGCLAAETPPRVAATRVASGSRPPAAMHELSGERGATDSPPRIMQPELRHFPTHLAWTAASIRLGYPPTRYELVDEDDQRHDQKEVNQRPGGRDDQPAQEPQNQHDHNQHP